MPRSDVVAASPTMSFVSRRRAVVRGPFGGRSVAEPARLAALAGAAVPRRFLPLFRFVGDFFADVFFFGCAFAFFFAGFFEAADFFLRFATGSPHPSGGSAKQLRGEPLNELITACTAKLFDIDCEVGVSSRMKRFRCRGWHSPHHPRVIHNEFCRDTFVEFRHCIFDGRGIGVGLRAPSPPSPPCREQL